ncbi:hypothetical protein [Rodentibacter sp. Ppn85]|uniref:hypothetical protein n=1 Tax=Rodentibacter sp. Ppn85 TaxID=1908525 RepID=UPI000987CE66|nr:hypothetical protein [Rodentibacter sp. Ppn85]OOF66046.1 hypothetical protein BKL51_02625 [Rodentibacter sp. Ppn85]
MKKILTISALTLVLAACKESETFYFTLDNPTNEKMVLTIDGKEHQLAAYSHEKLTLAAGEHTIENNEYKVNFTVFYDSKGGIINPTGNPYLIESLLYSVPKNPNNAAVRDVNFKIDGYPFVGPFSVQSDFIIDRSYQHSMTEKGAWNFDIFEVPPQEIKTDRGFGILKKIYNKNEFLDMVKVEAPDVRADYDQHKTVVKTKPTFRNEDAHYKNNMEIANSIKDEETKKYALQLIELDKKYAQAKGVKEQEKIKDDYQKTTKDYMKASSKMSSEAKTSMKGYVIPANFEKGIIINSVEVK